MIKKGELITIKSRECLNNSNKINKIKTVMKNKNMIRSNLIPTQIKRVLFLFPLIILNYRIIIKKHILNY
jgi:hypothetical protein